MTRTPITAVLATVRWGVHAVVTVLLAVVIVRVIVDGEPVVVVTLGAAVFGVLHLAADRARDRRGAWLAWYGALTCVWMVLVVVADDAAYLLFPLAFLAAERLGPVRGALVAALLTCAAVVGLARGGMLTAAAVIGPVLGAGVAVLVAWGHRVLGAAVAEREDLLRSLSDTRDELARTAHQAGALAERERLAREVHDTVSQSLVSVVMLIRASQARADERSATYLSQALDTAQASLEDTRRLVAELTPADLEGASLGPALARVRDRQWIASGLDVELDVELDGPIPMDVEICLLRVAQGAMANVLRHARATHARVTVSRHGAHVVLRVEDDGRGFDVDAAAARTPATLGLGAIRQRVEQLGGSVDVRSQPGVGTTVTARLEVAG